MVIRGTATLVVCAATLHLAACGRIGFASRTGGDDTIDPDAAADAASPTGFAIVDGGARHTCGIAADGRAYCWGLNDDGQLGDGTRIARATPVAVQLPAGRVTAVTAGNLQSCAIVDDAAWCWGGEALGTTAATSSTVPVAVENLPAPVTAISAGNGFTCAISNATLSCWGDDTQGRLGNGAGGAQVQPGPVAINGAFMALAAGGDHACAVRGDGVVFCWGHNDEGALGSGMTQGQLEVSQVPLGVVGLTGATAITIGGYHACAIADGAVWCWGTGVSGELGDGLAQSSPLPVRATLGDGVRSLETGGAPDAGDATCAVRAGAVHCWGAGDFGRLGTGAADPEVLPVVMPSLPPAIQISVGWYHACATTSDGAWCWGRGTDGQLGDGRAVTDFAPVRVVLP